jgi:(1->4)-alpha-D-glucan 1-alpha-D-glucosylmutase
MKNEMSLIPRIPVSTYRLQFNVDFGFRQAAAIVGYLHDLGISDIYSSPFLKAKKGSSHGYDIVDPTSLNPEVGTSDDLDLLSDELSKLDMGNILDIVPNHMGIGYENELWMDLLENGPASVYASYFDVDWAPVKRELRNKILLPVLGDHYGKILERGEFRLSFLEDGFFIRYYEHIFPVRPGSMADILGFRLENLETTLSPDDEGLSELHSIITALSHLPPYTVREDSKIKERYREKEIIKKRLWTLYNGSPAIMEHIDDNLDLINGFNANPESFDRLDRILRKQVYRLAYWQVASEEINYRRFFDINDLAAIRNEDEAVGEYTHRLIFRLIREGKVTGLRVDHPDGLFDPAEYFRWLQRHCFENRQLWRLGKVTEDMELPADLPEIDDRLATRYESLISGNPLAKPFYIVGEKILIKGERMPENWPIFSTTGYVFLNSLNGLFIDGTNAKVFDQIYSHITGNKESFQDMVCENKRLIMHVAMASEINTLGHFLNRISEKDRHTRDFTLSSLISALIEVIAAFPVYRTYISPTDMEERDRKYIEQAVAKAKRNNPAVSSSVFDFVKEVLLLNYPERFRDQDKKDWLDFVMRFQQITGPVMAKGVEDTTFYVYNRFVSLNEVGGWPERFGTPMETFHGQNIERIKYWPHALIASATHDTKRSEDVRARINVLSEMPDLWREAVRRWSRFNKRKKPVVDGILVPDRNEEYLFYQTLVGAWPVSIDGSSERQDFVRRIKEYMIKAAREAKVHSSWTSPNGIFEDALMHFIDNVLEDRRGNQFLADFVPFQRNISNYGMFNSLSQVLLKSACPGVPDFYQGTELWDFSLVDPDNRRPVDYEKRMRILAELKAKEDSMPLQELALELIRRKEDGSAKLFLTWKTLNFRRQRRDIFDNGEYIPLEVVGEGGENICAFARRLGSMIAVTVAPRFFTRLCKDNCDLPVGEETWGNSSLAVPFGGGISEFRNILTGEMLPVQRFGGSASIRLSDVLSKFPVALLEGV